MDKSWQEMLKEIFQEVETKKEDERAKYILKRLKDVMPEGIAKSFNNLKTSDEKTEFLQNLWYLAHPDNKNVSPEERREAYAQMARRCEEFFDSEEDSNPGWVF